MKLSHDTTTDGVSTTASQVVQWADTLRQTSFPKRDTKSAGVQVQYYGTTGQIENGQIGVFLSSVTAKGHSLLDRELYVPLDWTEDSKRCQEASIPGSVHFQTKPELAVQMLERIRQADLPIAWVVADTIYGATWICAPGSKRMCMPTCWPWPVMNPLAFLRLTENADVWKCVRWKPFCFMSRSGSAWP